MRGGIRADKSVQSVISLASGVMPGASPVETTDAAIAAGFDAVGLWVEPEHWSPRITREVRARLDSSGMHVLDVEVIWIKPGPPNPDHLRILDIGAEVGARNALVVSSDPDRRATLDKYAAICRHASEVGVPASLEFAAFTEICTLAEALSILREVESPASGLLIDPIHLSRSGGAPADLASLPRTLFRYAQFCDAGGAWSAGRDKAAIRQEAVDDRMLPGTGALPLAELLDALPPALPLSIEIRSKQLRELYPDYQERARVVAAATRAWLKGLRANGQAVRGGRR
jgi:sugar phosphate isomerase/epimerase